MLLNSILFHALTLVCPGYNHTLVPINNDVLLNWKYSTPNLYMNRGHLLGKITKIYPPKNGHVHFQTLIGNGTIEVIYNIEFGAIKSLNVGDIVEACGDYITSSANTPEYQKSPDGAILHWVHRSNTNDHPSGFLKINNIVYGI